MSNPSPFQAFAGSLNRGFMRLTDFLARLTFWRFAGLCFLMLLAAAIGNDIFFDSPSKPAIHIVKKRERKAPQPPAIPPAPLPAPAAAEPPAEQAPASPDSPPPTPGAQPAPEGSKPFEIRIGENGVVIKGDASPKNMEKLGELIEQQIEKRVEQELEEGIDDAVRDVEPRFSLPAFVMLLIVLMVIIRLVSKSKVKAEERAASAEIAADTAALSRQLAEAKLQAMQAQVEPHFLFNTLAAVEHLIETDPPRAATMQRNLIAYLRSVLPNLRQSSSTLGREAEIARSYLEILKFRMESRLEYSINITSGLESASVPPLMLQSLVENAIEHGIEPLAEGGRIDITGQILDGQLRIAVADTGVGFVADKARKTQGGVGLSSIRERLAALFGSAGNLNIEANAPRGTRITLEFPYAYKSSARADR